MKNSTDQGFDQHYNAQVATDQTSLMIVANTLSNHPNDKRELLPTLDAIAPTLGKPRSVSSDNGYFSEENIAAAEKLKIDPYIATGR